MTTAWGWVGSQQKSLEFEAVPPEVLAAGLDVAPRSRMRQRYNDTAKQAEISIDGVDYAFLANSLGSPWKEYTGDVVGLVDNANDVAVGVSTMFGTERLRVSGDTRVEGQLVLAPAIEATSALPNVIVGQNDQDTVIRLSRSASDQPHVYICNSPFTFFGVVDQVTSYGHNSGLGSRDDATKPGLWLQQELEFRSAAIGPNLAEWFGQWTNAAGTTVVRPVGFTCNYTTNLATWALNGGGSWSDTLGNQRCIFGEDGLITHIGSATGSLWLSGQDRPLLSASLNTAASAEVMRSTFAARANTGANGNILTFEGSGGQAFEWRMQGALMSWYPGNLVRGWVDATAWTMRHQFRTGYWFNVTIAGNQDNWSPTNLDISMGMRVDGGVADRTITGLSATNSQGLSSVDSRRITFKNVGTTNNLIFTHLDGASIAGNQFQFPGGTSRTVPPNGSITFLYDEVLDKWMLESLAN